MSKKVREGGMRSSGCEAFRELIPSLVDSGSPLSAAEVAALDRHLAACPDCRKVLEEDRAAWALLAHASAPLASGSTGRPADGERFLLAVRGRLQEGGAAPRLLLRWGVRASVAAAALALIGLGLLWRASRGEEEAIIENLAVLEDIDRAHPEGDLLVAETGRALLESLRKSRGEDPSVTPAPGHEEGDELDALLELLDSPGDEGEKRG